MAALSKFYLEKLGNIYSMAKRFTNTEKWTKDKWFRKLTPNYKLLWLYIQDNCDCVGVWEEDIEFYCDYIDDSVNTEEALSLFKDQIKIICNGKKWWIIEFCNFQYGVLDEDKITNKPHQRYIQELKKHSLWLDYKKTFDSLEEKEEDKDKEKEEAKESNKHNFSKSPFFELPDFEKEFLRLGVIKTSDKIIKPDEIDIEYYWNSAKDYGVDKSHKYANWVVATRTWIKRDYENKKHIVYKKVKQFDEIYGNIPPPPPTVHTKTAEELEEEALRIIDGK